MTSIRGALTLRLLGILGLMMTGIAVALFLGVRTALTSQFDATLRGRLATLESATRWDGHHVDLDYVSDATPWYQPGPDAEYFEIRYADGEGAAGAVIARSPSLGTDSAPLGTDGAASIANARLPDGRPGRTVSQMFRPAPEEDLDLPGNEAELAQVVGTTPVVRVTVAMSRQGLDAVLRTIVSALALAGAIVALGLVVGVRLALRSGLGPLRRFSTQLERLDADTLSTRLSEGKLPAELRPVHARLNDLIERLEVAFARERRFASAAAHELRTPVAELRSLLEVSLSRPRTATSAKEAMEEALGITKGMESLVGALLSLARGSRVDAGKLPPVQLAPILQRVAQRFEAAAGARGGGLGLVVEAHCAVVADPSVLESILSNVLANAVEYADPIADIQCHARSDGGGMVSIDVRNPVRDIDDKVVRHFFEPFWRRSESRTERSHLGLGLAVARALAAGMGGDISAALEEGDRVVCVRISLKGGLERHDSSGPVDEVLVPRVVPAERAIGAASMRWRV